MSQDEQAFEYLLAKHSAATLIGAKVGSLFNILCNEYENIEACICYFNKVYNPFDIYLVKINTHKQRDLIYVFRKQKLFRLLSQFPIQQFLDKYDYPSHSAQKALDFALWKLSQKDFPHEFGIFLGYPLYDVQCFIKQGNRGCQCIGCRCVYHHCQNAKRTFDRYDSCKKELVKRLSQGAHLEQYLST